MKRKSILTLIATLVLSGVVLTGCGSSTEAPVEEAVQEEEAIQEAGEAVDVEAEESVTVEESSARYTYDEVVLMTRAYGDFFGRKEVGSGVEGVKYYPIDIDSNGVPEIIYKEPRATTYNLVYLEKDTNNNFIANEIRVADNSEDIILTYNIGSNIIEGLVGEPMIYEESEDYSLIEDTSDLYRYSDFCMEKLSYYVSFTKEADYSYAALYLAIPTSVLENIGVDFTPYYYDELTGNTKYSYSDNGAVFNIDIVRDTTNEEYEYLVSSYKKIKEVQESWINDRPEEKCVLFSDIMYDSIGDLYGSGEVTIEALEHYTNTTYFADYFDSE